MHDQLQTCDTWLNSLKRLNYLIRIGMLWEIEVCSCVDTDTETSKYCDGTPNGSGEQSLRWILECARQYDSRLKHIDPLDTYGLRYGSSIYGSQLYLDRIISMKYRQLLFPNCSYPASSEIHRCAAVEPRRMAKKAGLNWFITTVYDLPEFWSSWSAFWALTHSWYDQLFSAVYKTERNLLFAETD